tara:strand:- start:215 stop:667 length:453 start_codon:yes stop_codon:yes gene_type:complete
MTQENQNGGVSLDDTRAALLNGYVRRTKLITTENGVMIELREPTVGQRARMLKAGGITSTNTDISEIGAMQVAAVIECCYHPGTGKALFNHTDVEVLQGLPTQSWFDEVATAAMGMMSTEPDEAGKPSEETESDSPSSSSPASLEKQLAS